MPEVAPDSADTRDLLDRAAARDPEALAALLDRYRPRMLAFVAARLDGRVRGRLDASDVVQEAQLEVARRMDDFLKRRPMPFHLWVRKTAYERVLGAHRDHLRRARRAAGREVALPERSSVLLAGPLLRGPSPSELLAAREFAARVSDVVADLPDPDREILLMRHVEELPYEEIACLLEIEPAAARKRYGRALIRLQRALEQAGLVEDRP
jgi:RNA polymerase sigma-70 factor (ECF subfamily)